MDYYYNSKIEKDCGWDLISKIRFQSKNIQIFDTWGIFQINCELEKY